MDGLKLVRGPFVVLMDADLSHHPKFIAALYRCVVYILKECVCVCVL